MWKRFIVFLRVLIKTVLISVVPWLTHHACIVYVEGAGPAVVGRQEHASREGRVHSGGLPEDPASVHHGVSRDDQQDSIHRLGFCRLLKNCLCFSGVRKLLQSTCTLSDLFRSNFSNILISFDSVMYVVCILMGHIDCPLLQIRWAVLTRRYVNLSATTRLDVQISHTPN